MRKFCCVHCRARIAVQPRHLGQLVTCPQCGRATHPLAEELAALQEPPVVSSNALNSAPAPHCANCGQMIGRLQKVNLWDNHVVCAPCHDALGREASRPASTPVTSRDQTPNAVPAPPASIPPREERETALAVVSSDAVPAAPSRDDTAASVAPRGLDYGRLKVIPLQLRDRVLAVLAAACIAGAAIYGALTLLRDLAGILTVLAIVLLAAAAVYLLFRAAWNAGKRAIGAGRTGGDRLPDDERRKEIEAVVTDADD